MTKRICLPVLGIVIALEADGREAVTSDLDDNPDDILSGSVPPVSGDYAAGRDTLYRILLGHARSGVDVSSAEYVSGLRPALEALVALRPHRRRWGWP